MPDPIRLRPGFPCGILAALVLASVLAGVASGQTTYTVTLNTAAVSGKAGKVVFDYTTSSPEQGATVNILNFTATGATIGLPSSIGGLITGDIILQTFPASSTQMTTDYFNQGAFLTELSVNFTKFSNSVTFQLQLPEFNSGSPPDQFAFYILDSNGNPWFTTADPLGANALFTDDVTGVAGGVLTVYAPAVSSSGNNISVVLPANTNGLSVNRSVLNFGSTPTKTTITSAQTVLVQAPAGAAWTVASNQPYVAVTPGSGSGNGSFSVSLVAASLPAVNPAPATLTVTAPTASNSPQTITVNAKYSATNAPYGSFDTPANNVTGISGAIPVTGWALDNIEVSGVDIWREKIGSEPVAANGLVFLGNAVFIPDARPDVQAANSSYPYSYRAGWGLLVLTNELPNSTGSGVGNGTYKIHAIAHDTTGASLDLGTRTITVDNAHATTPFGTIDTPAQGGTASTAGFVNFGWALTQNPYSIPLNGSTITVQLDGQNIGNPVYNQYRADIATLFPGLANSNGAIGYYVLDTTKLANGLHTIAWLVYDNQNRGAGIGSRFFNVFNTGAAPASAGPAPAPEARSIPEMARAMTVRRGYNPDAPAEELELSKEGWWIVDATELERIELQLGAVSGSVVANAERTGLPPGSSLDGGVFYWQLAPGLLGSYPLVFERSDGSHIFVLITVRPKSYSQ